MLGRGGALRGAGGLPGGEICCGTEDTTGTSYEDVTCATTCTTGVFATRVQFCDPTADACPSGTICRTSTVIQGYTVCR